MDTSDSPFAWLRAELGLIKSRGFHEFTALTEGDRWYRSGGAVVDVVGSYGDFLRDFGQASLFNGWGGLPEVPFLVYPLQDFRKVTSGDRRGFVAFGDRGAQHVFFEEAKVLSNESSAVYVLIKGEAKEIHPDFSDWLRSAYDWAKNRYSKRQWGLVIQGAAPFTRRETEIVEARQRFEWKHVGFAEDGDAIFAVENNSSLSLPFLSIGVKDCDNSILTGGIWLNVAHIGPGENGVAKADCYKDRIPPEKLVAFFKPDPTPEQRDRYWEFGVPV